MRHNSPISNYPRKPVNSKQVFYGMFASTESLAVFPIAPNGQQEQALRSVKVLPFFTQAPLLG